MNAILNNPFFSNSQIVIECSDYLPTQFLSEKINAQLNDFLFFCPDKSKIKTSFNWCDDVCEVGLEVLHHLKSFSAKTTKVSPFEALKESIDKLKSEIRNWRMNRYGAEATYNSELKIAQKTDSNRGSKIKVLFIDDDPITVKLIESCFRSQGCDTMVTTNGNDAIRLFENMNYDLIVLDWLMPNLTGADVLREGEHYLMGKSSSKIPVLTYSVNDSSQITFPDTKHFLRLGHIRKTTSYKRLKDKTGLILTDIKKQKLFNLEKQA